MNYRYLLFDLDGTLTDPKEGITKSVQYALKKGGYGDYDPDALTSFIGPPLHLQFCAFCGVEEAEGLRLVDVYRERFGTIGLFENAVFDGIVPMLADLKENGRILAVATSKPTFYTTQILDKYGLSPYFDAVVGSNMDGTRTVKCEVIGEVFAQLRITDEEKKECLMIGDRAHDMIGAKECGIDSMGVRFGYSEENELEEAGATYVTETVQTLRDFLLTH